jgi:hypothetical protein
MDKKMDKKRRELDHRHLALDVDHPRESAKRAETLGGSGWHRVCKRAWRLPLPEELR